MNEFKFRAECWADVENAVAALRPLGLKSISVVFDDAFPDVEATITIPISLGKAIVALSHVLDGHVMAETIEPTAHYTGERRPIESRQLGQDSGAKTL